MSDCCLQHMTQKKNILITGATGLIGQALVPFFISKGYNILILSRSEGKARQLFGSNVKVFEWPGENSNASWAKNLKIDVIINLAGASIGEKRWSKKYKDLLVKSRIASIEKLSQIITELKEPPQVWLQASAIGYYGYNVNTETDELGTQGQGFLANLVDKWEQAFDFVYLVNTRKVKLRFGLVLSESGGLLVEMKKTLKFGIAVCPGNGENYLSVIKIEDLIAFIVNAIESDLDYNIVNLVSATPIKMIDFVKNMKKESKAKVLIKIPALLVKIALGKEKAKELIFANQKVVSNII